MGEVPLQMYKNGGRVDTKVALVNALEPRSVALRVS